MLRHSTSAVTTPVGGRRSNTCGRAAVGGQAGGRPAALGGDRWRRHASSLPTSCAFLILLQPSWCGGAALLSLFSTWRAARAHGNTMTNQKTRLLRAAHFHALTMPAAPHFFPLAFLHLRAATIQQNAVAQRCNWRRAQSHAARNIRFSYLLTRSGITAYCQYRRGATRIAWRRRR